MFLPDSETTRYPPRTFRIIACLPEGRALSFELGDHRVRPPDPATQLAPEVGQELDRDGVMVSHQRVKSILGKHVADRLLVGGHRGRTWLLVEQRYFAKHGARGERGQPALPALSRHLDPHADRPARNQEEVSVEAALLDDDLARTIGAAHEEAPYHGALRFGQALEDAQAVHGDLAGQHVPGPV